VHTRRSHWVRVRDDRIVSIVLDAEAVIVDLETATYYTLSGAGALAWAMLDRGHGTSGVAAELSRRYGVGEVPAVEDVERLVDQLLAAGIVEPERSAREPAPLDVVVPDEPAYRTPILEVDPSALALPGEGAPRDRVTARQPNAALHPAPSGGTPPPPHRV
jgi:hypothetical protein